MRQSQQLAHKHWDSEPLPLRLALEQLLLALRLITPLAEVLPELLRQKAGAEEHRMLAVLLAHVVYRLVGHPQRTAEAGQICEALINRILLHIRWCYPSNAGQKRRTLTSWIIRAVLRHASR